MKKLIALLVSAVLLCTALLPALAESQKDETVYVLAAPNGDENKIIVSDWLTNPDGLELLPDVTRLADVQDVKGDAQLQDGSWTAGGKDVYYQGIGTDALPLRLKITYFLDDAEIAPDALAGKSGHVRIRFDYQVTSQAVVSMGDQEETVSVPFAVLTAALLENDVFTNVSVVNGQLVNDGDHTVVVGAALPGMQESLQLSADTLTLPEYVEIEADAESFALPLTLTVATSDVFAKLDSESLSGTDGLKADVAKLTDGMAQLLDGSTQLLSGLTQLSTGASSLTSGASQLSEGLNTLNANSETLVNGSAQVFDTLLAAAGQQLAAAGVDVPALTAENYSAVLDGLTAKMTEAASALAAQQSEAAQAQLAAMQQQGAALAVLKTQLDSYSAFHTGLVAYTQGVASAADGAQQLSDSIPALESGIKQLKDGAFSLKAGLTLFNAQGIEKVAKLANEDIEPLLVRVRGLLDAAQSYANYSGLAEGTGSAVRFIWRTDAIQP